MANQWGVVVDSRLTIRDASGAPKVPAAAPVARGVRPHPIIPIRGPLSNPSDRIDCPGRPSDAGAYDWTGGDFDFDGDVDTDDYFAMSDNWYESVACAEAGLAPATVVPEPSTFLLLGMNIVGLLAYAWRKRRCR